MKKPTKSHYSEIIEELMELKALYPSYTMGRHISTILDEYTDVWGITDKEFLFAIKKYRAQLQMDVPHEADEKELKKIIDDGMNLLRPDIDFQDGQHY